MSKRLTTEQFIEKAKYVHKDKYDYSLVEYISSDDSVNIICKKHGVFKIRAANHTSHKRGCKKCSAEKLSKKYSSSTKDFVKKASKIHNNKYNYEKTLYEHCDKKVTITCPIHGDFEQTPSNHLQDKGCHSCGVLKMSNKAKIKSNGWSYTTWENKAKTSKNFDSFKVYIIRCWNENEEFYKIGKTYHTVKYRFKNVNMPYKYEILKIFKGEAQEISELERILQSKNKQYKYIPKIKFNGMYECFRKIKN